ncbi:Rieske 2Fe-2S domain-containing protein [Herbiconiux moechotypicola]|uniref:Rieske domain-containing protein n=1 Tax=Herbiconiux moechotypicola TaxID=637393 RepID=A0ABN3DEP1_9MICO|nr:Rieske (2Fe-2S) protein [Herbiconiux moechotypicola]MCS5729336.1 Rieske 2Fe-2S domain-containing protein [Herbiconiux moechotypicola]
MTRVLPSTGTATVQPGPVTPSGWWPLVSLDAVRDSGRTAISVSIAGSPWAVVLLDGEVAAIRDLCPHRRVPLSAGTVADLPTGQVLECGYHGWSYDRAGQCAAIPALGEGRVPRGMGSVAALRTTLAGGIVWGTADELAAPAPAIEDGFVFLRPQRVPLPLAEVVSRLSGDGAAEAVTGVEGFTGVAGVELGVAGSALRYFVRPIDDAATSVFPLVDSTTLESQLPAWLARLDGLSAALAH